MIFFTVAQFFHNVNANVSIIIITERRRIILKCRPSEKIVILIIDFHSFAFGFEWDFLMDKPYFKLDPPGNVLQIFYYTFFDKHFMYKTTSEMIIKDPNLR
jgi:hypothetical protein